MPDVWADFNALDAALQDAPGPGPAGRPWFDDGHAGRAERCAPLPPAAGGSTPFGRFRRLVPGRIGKGYAVLHQARRRLLRTFRREGGRVVLDSDPSLHDIPLRDAGTPTYDGLPLDRYLSLFEMLNPMHRLWSMTKMLSRAMSEASRPASGAYRRRRGRATGRPTGSARPAR